MWSSRRCPSFSTCLMGLAKALVFRNSVEYAEAMMGPVIRAGPALREFRFINDMGVTEHQFAGFTCHCRDVMLTTRGLVRFGDIWSDDNKCHS